MQSNLTLELRIPDDFHVHLRQGDLLRSVLPPTIRSFGRVLVMPNTEPPILTANHTKLYRREIERLVPLGTKFEPLMTIQITERTTPAMIRAAASARVVAGKIYPKGMTTNSGNGVENFEKTYTTLEAMSEVGMVLCIHGESPTAKGCLEREHAFLPTLGAIVSRFPTLRIVLEHITTQLSVSIVESMGDNCAATITPHHLLLTLDDIVGDKLRPHHFCKPLPKYPDDRKALIQASISGKPRFFLGTDSAPHPQHRKECDHGCAGVFNSPVALCVLAQLFEANNALDKLENFTSTFGAQFYGLGLNTETIKLTRKSWVVPEYTGSVKNFLAGEELAWRIQD